MSSTRAVGDLPVGSTEAIGHRMLDRPLSAVVVLAPYYWIPAVPVWTYDFGKHLLVVLTIVGFGMIVVFRGTLFVPDRRILAIMLLLCAAFLPGIVRARGFSGLVRYVDYLSLMVLFYIVAEHVRHFGWSAVEKYRLLVAIAMVPQVLYVFGAAVGVIEPIQIPSVYRSPSEPYGAGFSAVQTQFSITLSLSVPLLLGYLVEAHEEGAFRRQVVLGLLFVPICVSFLASHGRSGILSAAVGALVFAFLYRRKLFVLATAVVVGTNALIWTHFTEAYLRFTKLDLGLNRFTSNRLEYFSKGLDILLEYPLLGIGFKNRPLPVDNLYLAAMIESGILPGTVLILFVTYVVLYGYRITGFFESTEHEIVAISLFAAVMAYIPSTLFERGVVFLNFYVNVGWWVCLALLFMLPLLDGGDCP